jgi:error-prone DNA polymerase
MLGLSLKRRPLSLRRPALQARSLLACRMPAKAHDGRALAVAGLVLVRQKAGSVRQRYA